MMQTSGVSPDHQLQADAYQALLETFEGQPWWAGVVLGVPVERQHLAHQAIEPRGIGDVAREEGARVPVDKHIADVEDHRGGAGGRWGGRHPDQPWRALKRRLVLLMT